MHDPKNIGFVGLGMMGRPMAANLIAAKFQVTVYDSDPKTLEGFVVEHQCSAASSLAELGASSDLIVTMLPNGKIVRQVVLGEGDCLVDGFRTGGIIVDMSSSDPTGTEELGTILADRGIQMLDAPVSGGVGKAIDATLAIMVGGLPETVDLCEPVLRSMGGKIFRTGKLGSAHAVKALNNMLSAAGLIAAAEVMLVAKRFGLDPDVVLDALNSSTGRNNSTENKYARYVLSRAFNSGFSLDLMVKDLGTAMDLARHTETPVIFSALCRELCAGAQRSLGPGKDHTDVVRWFEELCGAELVSEGQK